MALTPPVGTWNNVMIGSKYDPPNDQQANSNQDLVGDATNAMLQSQRTGSSNSDFVYHFRARFGDTAVTGTSFYLAIDTTGDKVADVFVEAKVASNGSTKLAYHKVDPTKSGTGPSTTGWMNSTNDTTVEMTASTNDSYVTVSSAGTNLDNAGGTDSWVNFGFTLASLRSFSPASTVTGDTGVVLYAFTSTSQTANGDIAGVNDQTDNLSLTWSQLGLGISTSLNTITTTSFGTPTVSVSPVTVSEASPYIVFKVQLDIASPSAISFTPLLSSSVGAGNATIGTDVSSALEYYNGTSWVSAASGVSITGGLTSVLVRAAVTSDTLYEGSEVFTFSTGTISGTVTSTAAVTAQGTIVDDGSSSAVFLANNTTGTSTTGTADNDKPAISVSSPTVTAGGNATFTVSLSNASTGDVTFTPTLSDGTAVVGTDTAAGNTLAVSYNGGTSWTTVSGSITIAAGSTSVLLRLLTVSDADPANETFSLAVGSIAGTVSNSSGATGTATILPVGATPPVITGPSGGAGAATSAITINENGTTVTTLSADTGVSWSIVGGQDQAMFSINPSTGALSFISAPSYESPTDGAISGSNTYIVEVQATKTAGGYQASQVVTVTIANLDEVAPDFSSSTTAASVNENSGAGQVVYTATALDTDFNAPNTAASITYGLGTGLDESFFSINPTTGAVTLIGNPDFETKSSYSFTVTATDAAGNIRQQVVSLLINDIDEIPPLITGPSGSAGDTTSAITVNENQTTVTTLTANETVTWSLAGGTGQDQAKFAIDATTGALTFVSAPDYENPTDGATSGSNTYLVQVKATDTAGNVSVQLITVTVANVDDTAPLITGPSGSAGDATSAITVNENQTTVTTLTANETVTWSLAGGTGQDQAKFAIDATTGALTFVSAPDYENPTDGATSGSNTYLVQVKATDTAGNVSLQVVTVTVADVNETPPAPPVVQPPPPVVVPPQFTANLDPKTDTGELDNLTKNTDPEFTLNGGSYLQPGRFAQLVDPSGAVIGQSPVTAAESASGKINVPTGQLDDGVYTYIAQILDAAGNVVVSTPVTVTIVTDRDGVMPSVELAANNGDFNKDGIKDWEQNNVAQLPITSTAAFNAGKNAPAASFGAIMAGTPDASSPDGVKLDNGAQLLDVSIKDLPSKALPSGGQAKSPLIQFSVQSESSSVIADVNPRPGLQVQTVIDLPAGVDANAYMKFNAKTQAWVNFTNAAAIDGSVDGAALIDRNGDGKIDRIVLTLTDGGQGDEDGLVNGTIVDPGALATVNQAVYFSTKTNDRILSTTPASVADATHIQFYTTSSTATGTVALKAWQNVLTGDWFYGRADMPAPYACYVERPDVVLGRALEKDQGAFNVHTYLNGQGITQIMSTESARSLGLEALGYRDLGDSYVFASTDALPVTLVGLPG